MSKKIIILTGSELRHDFFRVFISNQPDIEIINSYCEGQEKNLVTRVEKETDNDARKKHLENRAQSEKTFFEGFVKTTIDNSKPIFLPAGEINNSDYTQKIINSKPDLIIAYGCSLIKEPLISSFAGKFLNVHLGLSPYYRGGGTNYWPLVNNEPEYVGATFMYIDAGVDTGEIIHQIRARILPNDTPSSIGNRLIQDMAPVYADIIRKFDQIKKMPQPAKPLSEKVYKQKDYTEESVTILYQNFDNGLVEKYISSQNERIEKVPIVTNPTINL